MTTKQKQKTDPVKAHCLTRSGDAPIAFSGVQLGAVVADPTKEKRWHDLHVYRTEGGSYVVWLRFLTKFDPPYEEAEVFKDQAEIFEWLSEYDPTHTLFRGDDEALYEKLCSRVTSQFEDVVSKVMMECGFAERID